MSSLVAPSSLHYTACTAWGTAALQDWLPPLASNIKCVALPAAFFLHPILPTTVVDAVAKAVASAVAHAYENISISANDH